MSVQSDDDESFLREALPAFISESLELLDQLEQLLLELEAHPGDRELLDALFRCAHTIKGSAGLFGLDDIVAFTHHVETFLDALREDKTTLDAHSSRMLLQSGDQIRRLIAELGAPQAMASRDIPDEREAMVAALRAALQSAVGPGDAHATQMPASASAAQPATDAHKAAQPAARTTASSTPLNPSK